MKVGSSHLVTICIAIVWFLTGHDCCDLNCGEGNRCVMIRSTCDYPPCPFFPTCVARHHGHHAKHKTHKHSHQQDAKHKSSSILHKLLIDESVTELVSRPGQCPVPMSNGPCVTQCQSDVDCQVSEKCCNNSCGKTCRPVNSGLTVKPGSCPAVINNFRCSRECSTDDDCPGFRKCCRTACGATCSVPCFYWLRPQESSRRRKLPFICRRP